MMQWNEAQREVIKHRKGSVLVSAAAGSGKTAVLVERTIQMLLEDGGPELDQFLIVTFTKLAAKQMKDKIRKALEEKLDQDPEDKRLQRLLAQIPNASVMTIDAFCQSVVRKYIAKIEGLDPAFRIEEKEVSLLKREVMEDTLYSLYEKYEGSETVDADAFRELTLTLGTSKTRKTKDDQLLNLYRFMQNEPEPMEWLKEQTDHTPLRNAIYDTMVLFDQNLKREKLARGLLEYADFEHFAHDLICHDEQVAAELRKEYAYILIDEYQDSNRIQEDILQGISRQSGNIFMVGDVKQSIYGFRNACPELFSEKLNDPGFHKIYLQENYRSRKEIVDGVNEIFGAIMTPELGGVAYDENQKLNAARSCRPDRGHHRPTLHCTTFTEEEYVARAIRYMLDHKDEFPVTGEDGSTRELRASDIAILHRKNKTLTEFRDRLAEFGIAGTVSSKDNFFDTFEIKLCLSVLHVIDNPRQDIPLHRVLTALFGVEENELVFDRDEYQTLYDFVSFSDRFRDFSEQLNEWRNLNETIVLSELVSVVFDDLCLREVLLCMDESAKRLQNLDELIALAAEFDSGIYNGLFHFLHYADDLIANEDDLEIDYETPSTDCVQMMTIHKSKGLQFPVVFVCGMNGPLYRASGATMTMHKKLGYDTVTTNADNWTQRKTQRFEDIEKQKEADSLSESIRLLYVALTRAQDYLYMIAAASQKENKKSYKAYLEKAHETNGRYWDIANPFPSIAETMTANAPAVPEPPTAHPFDEKALNWEYPFAWRNALPTHFSVSSLKSIGEKAEPMLVAGGTDDETEPTVIIRGAQRGTLYHLAMQHLDFSKSYTPSEIAAFLDELKNRHRISELEAEEFPTQWLETFTRSALFQRMSMHRIYREESFLSRIPFDRLKEILPDYELPCGYVPSESVSVQGVIDAMFVEDGQWVIVDYKTDYDLNETKLETYRRQVKLYAYALSQATGMPVKEGLIYAVRKGETIAL